MIKKGLSITTIILVLTAMLHFSVATHYCGGTPASTKVSLSGELATCGMETKDIQPVSGLYFSSHCCDNDIRYYGIRDNYYPSLTIIPYHFHQVIQTLDLPVNLFKYTFASLTVRSSESPPGLAKCNSVDLADICTLRI